MILCQIMSPAVVKEVGFLKVSLFNPANYYSVISPYSSITV